MKKNKIQYIPHIHGRKIQGAFIRENEGLLCLLLENEGSTQLDAVWFEGFSIAKGKLEKLEVTNHIKLHKPKAKNETIS